MKVIFFGTPPFAAKTLEYLLGNQIEVVAVVTKPDKPKGRSGTPLPTAVKQVALAHQLPLYQPVRCSSLDFAPTLAAYEADLFVVVAYGEIIKEHLLRMPRLGCINVHGSLLPKYRGAAPIQRCLMQGEAETGISIMYMVKEMDAGDVIRMERVPIGPEVTAGELESELCEVGAKALLDVLLALEQGPVPHVTQDASQVTFAPKVELNDCRIDWQRPARDIHNLVRGANPEPGAWCLVSLRGETKRLKIWRTQAQPLSGTPGRVILSDKRGPVIACGHDSLRLLQVQLEGKKAMSGEELFRGIHSDLAIL